MNVYGTPAGALVKESTTAWTTTDRVNAGRKGEAACARLLAKTFAHDPDVYVFHDLSIPGMKANIDHAVIRGPHLLLVDAKRWRPGIYWTIHGQTRRGMERIAWADKATMPAALRIIREQVAADPEIPDRQTTVSALTLVFPSAPGTCNTWLYRPPDNLPVRVVGRTTHLWLRHRMSGDPSPPSALLKLLWSLLKDQTVAVPHGQTRPRTPTTPRGR